MTHAAEGFEGDKRPLKRRAGNRGLDFVST